MPAVEVRAVDLQVDEIRGHCRDRPIDDAAPVGVAMKLPPYYAPGLSKLLPDMPKLTNQLPEHLPVLC